MVDRRAMVGGLFGLLGLVGCAEPEGEDTGVVECTSVAGTVEGVVYEDYSWNTPESGEEPTRAGHARVNISQEGVDPFTAMADADGYYSVELQEATWDIYATDSGEGCVSEMGLSVEIVACETVQFDIALTDCLLGG